MKICYLHKGKMKTCKYIQRCGNGNPTGKYIKFKKTLKSL